jgi:uncharacterized membrane protein
MAEDQRAGAAAEPVGADVAVDEGGEEPSVVGSVVTDGAYTLFAADFSDIESAWEAYEALKSIEDGRHVEIEGVVVVKRDADGTLEVQKATDHSTKRGLAWGVVGGVVLGVIFPPSILGSAAVLGAAGAAAGKARELHHRNELATDLQDVILPGHSGILALVSDPGAVEIRKALEKADTIVESAVDDVAARDIKAAAHEAESGDDSAVSDEA